ncbi:MAG: TIGR03905 family TSCPD domain-containing protein [Muribaculaceae bacterium]|nr:TIGR03905 family TSCPD domain-containing protein [Muribaculaceae bacterium]
MRYTYYTHGTCSSQIDFEIDDQGIIRDVQFMGGCHGNLQGIAILVRGMKASEVIEKLRGVRCGYKNTSCPDQLATALYEALNNNSK